MTGNFDIFLLSIKTPSDCLSLLDYNCCKYEYIQHKY